MTPYEAARNRLFYDMPIQRKLALAFGTILGLFVLTCVMVFINVQDVRAAREVTLKTYRVIGLLGDLRNGIVNQQLGQRGYIIAHDPSFIAPYQAGLEDFETAWDQLKDLTVDNPVQQQRLDSVRAIQRQWLREFARPSIEAARKPETMPAAQEMIVADASRRLIERIHHGIDSAAVMEQTLLAQRLGELQRNTRQLIWVIAGMLSFGALIGILALRSSSRLITAPIVQMTELMTRLSKGEHAIDIPGQERKDEIGDMARATEVFKKVSIEGADTTWVKSHVGALSGRLQQARSQAHFAETLVDELAPLLHAGLAVFYYWREESQRLELLGSYGFRDTTQLSPAFALGEGLVGQAAKERHPIMLGGVPDSYSRIHSGIGSAAPRAIAVIPLVSQDQLLGVIEIGTFAKLTPVQQRLVEELVPVAALALENLSNVLKTERLLAETQQQAERLRASEEELRAQQEELRATNESLRDKSESLEEQSRALQASEEELRTQSEELRVANMALEEKSELQRAQQTALEQAQATLEEKALQLERASQYKSDFLANMSHELRTPLNSMLILSRSLADNDEGNLTPDQVESARIVHDSGKNLLLLINDILDLSKVEAGKMEAVAEDVTLADFTSQLERNFRALAAERKLKFEVRIAPELPAVIRTDEAKLQQIATNLLSNAFKFTHEGTVRLDLARPDPGVALETPGLNAGNAVQLSVTDSGIGIPPDKIARIFQSFEQGDTSTSRRYGGTGLGLAICKGLARLLGGEISVTSKAGQGSVFTLVIAERLDPDASTPAPVPAALLRPPAASSAPAPVAPAPSAPATATATATALPPPPAGNGRASILVVEDDVQFAQVLASIARGKGYEVLTAHDGETGLALAQSHRPVGILLDIGLPGISGWQVMDLLKREPSTASIPVHFISGADDSARAYAAGAAGYLRKPVNKSEVNAVIDGLTPAEGRRRLLLVDSIEADRKRVREMLRAEDADIDEVATAEEGLERLAANRYDLVILDLDLPEGLDGFAFLEAAAKRGPLPAVLIHSGRDLTREESLKLREYTDAIVMKAAPTMQRLLDEATLFLHSIKRASPAPQPAAPDRAATPAELGGRTVLIVDDDMRNIFALSKALRSRGLKVVMAQDGPKALAQLDNNPAIDIVLMDIMMPGMDGYETMRQIRSRPQWQTLPIIAVTAKAMVGDREKCLEAGATDYCSKPIDVGQLVGQMQRLVGGTAA